MARYALPGDNVFPEGITEGGGTTFFVGSMGDGTIYRGDTATGTVEVFVPPDGDGRVTITGLDLDGYGRLVACDYDGGQLFVYDLATRKLAARRALPAEEAWPNDVVAHPDENTLLVASQGEGGTLWRVDLAGRAAAPVDLGGYEFNADGMLLDGDLLYGVTNRGEDIASIGFMISVARLAPGWRSAAIVTELSDPDWDCPTTLAAVDGKLLIVCSQVRAMHTKTRHTCPSRSPPPTPRTCPHTSSPASHNQHGPRTVCGGPLALTRRWEC